MHGLVRERLREFPVTARATTLRGPDAGAYYVEQLGSYYLDGDEPPGRWHGRAAAELGLAGEIEEDAFLALMDGTDPTTGRALGSAHSERTVRGFDVTFSAPKSLSVLYAVGGQEVCDAVLASHDAAVAAVIDWIEEHAHTRYRVHGQIHTFDADGIVAVAFRQHVSRELDPQLHTHVVIPNRVLAPDGRWLALDARTLKRDQRTLSAIYHAGVRAEVTARLGVRWETPENGIAEIADIPQEILAAYSCRTREVRDRVDRKIERFTETFEREPTPRERWRLEREAVIDSRPSKSSSDAPTLAQEWTGRLVGLGIEPDTLLDRSLDHVNGHPRLDAATVDQIMSRAVEALIERQSTWRPAEVTREVAAALPTSLGLPAHEVAAVVETLRSRIETELLVDLSHPVPVGVQRRRDGRPVTESAMERALTTPDIVAQEHLLLERAERRLEAGGRDATTICDPGRDPEPNQEQPGDGTAERVEELSGPQLEAAAAVAGSRELVLVVGPAGTGKTTALHPAVEQLRAEGRTVFGVAPSAAAAEVLATDTGVDAETIDKLLVEHRLTRPPEHRYDLPPGATVIVDEAAMVSTPNLVELFALAEHKQWRLALVGDPLQFAAVGRAGMFGYLVDQFGAVQLDQVHRFAEPWERNASLRLRRSDPGVVEDYDTHGRLHGGTARQMTRQALDAWTEARAAGETVALMAPTREAVTILNQRAQHRRMEAGELDRWGTTLEIGDYHLREGDEIATRHNDRHTRTTHGLMVKNRDHWTVDTIHPDGGLTVTGRTGTVRLEADYVAEHVELAYAQTSHANQGRTVDRSVLYLDGPTDTRGIYVPLTRGRHTNDAYIALTGEQTPADVIAESLTRTWIDRPALEVHQELNPPHIDSIDTGKERSIDRLAPTVEERVEPPDVAALVQRRQELTGALEQVLTPDMRQHLERRINDLEQQHEQRRSALERSEAELDQARTFVDRHDGPIGRRRHREALNAAHRTARQTPGTIDWTRRDLARLDQELHHARTDLDHRTAITRDAPDIRAELSDLQRELADRGAMRPSGPHRSTRSLPELRPSLMSPDAVQQQLELQRQRQRSIDPPSLGL